MLDYTPVGYRCTCTVCGGLFRSDSRSRRICSGCRWLRAHPPKPEPKARIQVRSKNLRSTVKVKPESKIKVKPEPVPVLDPGPPPPPRTRTCDKCSKQFTPASNNQKYCSDSCRTRKVYLSITCRGCGEDFIPNSGHQKRCKPLCVGKPWAPRTCSKCGAEYTPTGTTQKRCEDCRSSHMSDYMKTYKVAIVACAACGEITTHGRGRGDGRRPACDSRCRSYLRCGLWPQSKIPQTHAIKSSKVPPDHSSRAGTCIECNESYSIRGIGQLRCRSCKALAEQRKKDQWLARVTELAECDLERRQGLPRFASGSCMYCGVWFVADRLATTNLALVRYCSDRCASNASKHRRRARKRDGAVYPVRRGWIFDRDDWTCKLCGDLILREVKTPHPLAPTLDHIIPLAKGGAHSEDNLQAAHFLCNSLKGDRVLISPTISEA